jgi:mono/diheme cytochrome c family protein
LAESLSAELAVTTRLVVCVVVGLSVLAPFAVRLAADAAGPPNQSGPSPAEVLFNAHCGICHLQMGPGTIMLGRRLGPDHALLDERRDLGVDYIKHVVRNGIGGMPPQTRVDLPDAELDTVAAYLNRPAAERRPPRPVLQGGPR